MGVSGPSLLIDYMITLIHTRSSSYSVPSGHILTKQELQVLRTLLAPYTDEKLKELQLLIQKKQEGEILREDVEKSLRQSGLTMIADRLKDDIEKGKKEITLHILLSIVLCAWLHNNHLHKDSLHHRFMVALDGVSKDVF